MWRMLAFVAALAVAGAFVGRTTSAFSAQTGDGGNTFEAAAIFGCSSPGTQAVSASADSWVDELMSTGNFGTDTMLGVRSLLVLGKRALVTFPLPSIPNGCSVTLATLRLYASSATSGRTIDAYQVASSWSESTVTWSNQPGTSGAPATTSSASGWNEWDVTSIVQTMYAGSNDGFLLKDASEGGVGAEQLYASREASSTTPELVITFG